MSGLVHDNILTLYTRHLHGDYPGLVDGQIEGMYHICDTFFWPKIIAGTFWKELKSWLGSALERRGLSIDAIKYFFVSA